MAEQHLEPYRSRFRLDAKTALVLGAASGIGKACGRCAKRCSGIQKCPGEA